MMQIRSVVLVKPREGPLEKVQNLIDVAKARLVKDFGDSVLSGKLHEETPMRGILRRCKSEL